jgi:hypothetical protein
VYCSGLLPQECILERIGRFFTEESLAKEKVNLRLERELPLLKLFEQFRPLKLYHLVVLCGWVLLINPRQNPGLIFDDPESCKIIALSLIVIE